MVEAQAMANRAYRCATTLTYCCTLFLAGNCLNIIGPAGPLMAKQTQTSVTMIGNIFTGEGVGATLGNLFISPLLDRAAGHSVICSLCLVLVFAIGLVPHCTSFQQVVLLYVVVGGCLGGLTATSNTMVSWVMRGHNVGPYVNLVNACFGAGASSAPLLFVLVEHSMGNGLAAFSAIAAFAVVPAFGAWLVESPVAPPKLPRTESEEDPLNGLGKGRGSSKVRRGGWEGGWKAGQCSSADGGA